MFNLNRITFVLRDNEPLDGGASGAPDPSPAEPPAGGSPPPADPPAGGGEITPFYDALPDTWRNELVNSLGIEDVDESAKRLAQLDRVPDFKTLTKNYFSSQDKIREGVKPVGLVDNATDEQVAEYREANGIPLTVEDYATSIDEGLVLGDVDTRIMDEVFAVAHTENVSSDVMGKLTNAMLNARVAEEDLMLQQDGIDTQTTRTQLKDAWGSDHQTNLNMVKGLTNQLPESMREDFMNARMADGTALFNSPEFLIFMADIARKVNPAGTVVPNSANPTQAIDDEIKTLEAKMGTDAWYKDTKSQKRLQDLYTAAENMSQ
jgi:hypothetical protein